MAAPHPKFVETQEDEHNSDAALAISALPEHLPPLFATVSISQSLSTVLPSHFFHHPKVAATFSPSAASVRLPPTQASSLSHLSLSAAAAPSPSRISFRSTISANPLQSPLTLGPRRPLDPSGAAGLRRAAIVWFRNDLRLHDNECLVSANNESLSVLPVYCFDPRDYGKSSSGFDKTGPFRASFVIESVSDLRRNLQSRGSDLVVRVGKPEDVLVEMAKAVGADAVYAHSEVSRDEVRAEDRVGAAMKEEGVVMKYSWGSTLFHVNDLPFKVEDMPTNYGSFREKVQGLEVRKTVATSDNLKGLPKRGDVEPGEMPTLLDLGVNPSASTSQDGKAASMVGGETEAMQRLKKFAAECQAQPNKGASENNVYGANFSCKISPWLTNGCISPRAMFEELKSTATNVISASSKKSNGGDDGSSGATGSNWLMYELLWRDFFRFITKKYSLATTPANSAPVCAGAAA